MKEFIKKIFVWKLNVLAQIHLRRYKPMIIGVTGNVGKTSTKEAIAVVVGRIKNVRVASGNLNNEFGFPLTILGNWDEEYYSKGSSLGLWLKVLLSGAVGLFFRKNSPEVLILEYGADKPDDIKCLVDKFRPHISVVTAVGEVPVHVEFFSGSEGVAREKSKLVEPLFSSDFAVLNFDDLAVLEMKEKTKAKVLTYGYGEGAKVKVSNLECLIENDRPIGVAFKIHCNDSFVPFKINGSLGKSQGYAAAAAAAVGVALGMNLVDISEALSEYHGPKGRLKIISGIKNSIIIDDTYNASPASTHLALETFRDLPVQSRMPMSRKVAVLGDMLELGKYTIDAHREAGNLAGSFVGLMVCVGARAKFIAEAAGNQMPMENIHSFDTSNEAKIKVKELIKEGDLVLIKGSQGMRMEKIVEEIMAEPQNAKKMLARQSQKWLSK